MLEILIVAAYALQAVVLGLMSLWFLYRVYLNHLTDGVRQRVLWLGVMFASFSALTLMRLPYRIGQAFHLPFSMIPPDSIVFAIIVFVNALSAWRFWVVFRHSIPNPPE